MRAKRGVEAKKVVKAIYAIESDRRCPYCGRKNMRLNKFSTTTYGFERWFLQRILKKTIDSIIARKQKEWGIQSH
jgi:hypothetical protein